MIKQNFFKMKFKNTLYRIKSRPHTTKKKKISEFEETAMETIREAQRENKMNRVPVTCGIM